MYVLSASASDALLVTGTGSVTAVGCGIHVNSSHATKAIDLTGSATISGTTINVKGGYTLGPATTSSPMPTTGSAPVPDPLASLATPSVSTTCYKTNYSLGSSNTDTISPLGVYCGGITVAGSAHLIMTPGTYILNGGGFTNSHGGLVTATGGVTIFLTGQNGYTAGGMQLLGNSVTTLSAPSSGPYQGILFYQDRSVTYAGGNSYANSATLNATGSLYFKTTSLTLSGNVAGSKTALVVSTLNVAGSSTFNQDSTGTFTGLASRSPGLIQ